MTGVQTCALPIFDKAAIVTRVSLTKFLVKARLNPVGIGHSLNHICIISQPAGMYTVILILVHT